MNNLDKHYAILRRPCLPEDEGRFFVERVCHSRQEAEEWIKNQKGKYFGPSDYLITEAAHD